MSKKITLYNSPRHMEPLLPEAKMAELAELTCSIHAKAGELRGQVHSDQVRKEIARLVRKMNCYYSNLIEGHKTRPRDIERALKQDFSDDPKQRDNQKLSVAHIHTEEAMVARLGSEPDLEVYSPEFIAWIHEYFYKHLPESLQITKTVSGQDYPIIPGQWREYMVDVGKHAPPRPDSLDPLLERFHSVYSNASLIETQRLTAIAAAHHRLAWIHPFGDGNGRVTRLHSHALLMKHGLGGHGLWTISRGLARYRDQYSMALQKADQPRTSDIDGRGNLSDRGLAEFCVFFLKKILDQIEFMSGLLALPTLRQRIERIFTHDLFHLGKDAQPLMQIVLILMDRGEIPRSEVQKITSKGATVSARLIKLGLAEELFSSPSPKGVLQFHIGPKLQDDLFPKLFLDLPLDAP